MKDLSFTDGLVLVCCFALLAMIFALVLIVLTDNYKIIQNQSVILEAISELSASAR